MIPLSRKITIKMFLIYISIYLCTLVTILLLVRPKLEREADTTARDSLSLMSTEIENVQNLVTEYSQSFLYSNDIADRLSAYDAAPSIRTRALVNQALSNYVVSSSSLLALSLEDTDHNYFSAIYFTNVCNKESALADPDYQNLMETQNGSYYKYITPEIFKARDFDYNYHAMEYTQVIRINRKNYILRTYAKLSIAISHLNALSEHVFSDIAILYSDGTAAYTSGEKFTKDTSYLKDIFSYHLSQDQLMTKEGVYFYQKNVTTGWILLGYAPYTYYYYTMISIVEIVTLLYIASAAIYTVFLIYTIRYSLRPLEQLNQAMQDYSAGASVRTDIHTRDEIEKLNGYFVEMTDKINQQVEDIKEQEHVNSVVNYKLLATQIDPHFIYNTMNIINIMARQGNTEAIVEINSALIKILRERLNTKLSITDTVENERDTLYQYFRIMNYRYENKIQLSMDVDDALLQCQIPKNILQPLAENSFYHGFPSLSATQEGYIDIMIYSIEDELVLEISDNGAGISPERLEILRNHSYEIYNDKKPHIGLDNVRQRLTYMYGGQYQFDIQSTEGYGTTISITIPLVK